MNKKTKESLILATALILFGAILFGGVMMSLGFDFKKLSTIKYKTNTHNIGNQFKNISIISNTANITLIPSESEEGVITCYEQKNITHSVDIKDDTLTIKVNDTRKWYEHIGVSFENSKITVSIPAGEYGKLNIKSYTGKVNVSADFKFESVDISQSTGDIVNCSSASGNMNISTTTGDIVMDNISANDVNVKVSTGKINLTNINCNNLTSKGTTGNFDLENVIATGKMKIERNTGNISFTKCDASEIRLKTTTGDVKGSLLSGKMFSTKTSTGKVDVPKTFDGGKCEISTSTGNIKVTIE